MYKGGVAFSPLLADILLFNVTANSQNVIPFCNQTLNNTLLELSRIVGIDMNTEAKTFMELSFPLLLIINFTLVLGCDFAPS